MEMFEVLNIGDTFAFGKYPHTPCRKVDSLHYVIMDLQSQDSTKPLRVTDRLLDSGVVAIGCSALEIVLDC